MNDFDEIREQLKDLAAMKHPQTEIEQYNALTTEIEAKEAERKEVNAEHDKKAATAWTDADVRKVKDLRSQAAQLKSEINNLQAKRENINAIRDEYEQREEERRNRLDNLQANIEQLQETMKQAEEAGDLDRYTTAQGMLFAARRKQTETAKPLPEPDFTPEVNRKANEIRKEVKRITAVLAIDHLNELQEILKEARDLMNETARIETLYDFEKRPADPLHLEGSQIIKIQSTVVQLIRAAEEMKRADGR